VCGIAGIIYRDSAKQPGLSLDLMSLVQPLQRRGPDSCGVGLYGNRVNADQLKMLLLAEEEVVWAEVWPWFAPFTSSLEFEPVGHGYRVLIHRQDPYYFDLGQFKNSLAACFPQIHLMSVGQQLEIYKEVGPIQRLVHRYGLEEFAGSHGIGHTRMATESVVDTYHSHPFTSGFDLSIVHNGQISNYYRLRAVLERRGMVFETHNDSEAIAHYLQYQLLQGKSLEASLHELLKDLDGTYTFLVATTDKIALVRDKFAAKPALIYESPSLVAIASEYHCLLNLPGFDPTAVVREPDAGEVNIWSVPTPIPLQDLKSSVDSAREASAV
jgi:methylamine---glutamate N-methyltransferase subunit A